MERILLVVQARLASTRFPRKVLANLSGQPMILRQLDRLAAMRTSHHVVVASPSSDTELSAILTRHGYDCALVDGDQEDVLSRYARVAHDYMFEHIVRITGDCPLIDPMTVDAIIGRHLARRAAHTGIAREWGDGNDVEVMTHAALTLAEKQAVLPSDREHVTPFLYNHPEKFSLQTFPCPLDASWLRYSVDTEEDLRMVEYIYNTLTDLYGQHFGWRDILHLAAKDRYLKKYMLERPHNTAYVQQVAEESGVQRTWDALRYGGPVRHG